MKSCLLVAFFLFSQLSFASDLKSDLMVELLLNSGVEPFGKKELLNAEVGCKKTEKEGLFCFVSSITASEINNLNYVEYSGEEANNISNLLKDFNIMPYGKKSTQSGSFECLIPKNSIDGKRNCRVLEVVFSPDANS